MYCLSAFTKSLGHERERLSEINKQFGVNVKRPFLLSLSAKGGQQHTRTTRTEHNTVEKVIV